MDTAIGFRDAFDAVLYFASFGDKSVVWVDDQERRNFLFVGQAHMLAAKVRSE